MAFPDYFPCIGDCNRKTNSDSGYCKKCAKDRAELDLERHRKECSFEGEFDETNYPEADEE